MKKMALILTVLMMAIAPAVQAQSGVKNKAALNKKVAKNDYRLLGRFLYVQKNAKKGIYKSGYYFKVNTDDGKTYAYPAEFLYDGMKNYVDEKPGRLFYVSTKVTYKNIQVGEKSQRVPHFKIDKMQAIEMGSFSVKSNADYQRDYERFNFDKGEQPDKINIKGVNDKVTNALIYIGGAALLGNILSN